MSLHGTKHLETERLYLRPVSVKDAEILHTEILGNKERLYYLDWNYSADINATKAFVENIISNYQKEFFFFWLIEEKLTRNFIGCVMVCNSDIKRRLAEIEYVAGEKAQGHGYITEALKRVIQYLIQEIGYYRIEGVCNIENTASARVMEKAGMVLEGTLRGRALNLNEAGNPGDLRIYSILSSDLK